MSNQREIDFKTVLKNWNDEIDKILHDVKPEQKQAAFEAAMTLYNIVNEDIEIVEPDDKIEWYNVFDRIRKALHK